MLMTILNEINNCDHQIILQINMNIETLNNSKEIIY